MSRSVNRATFEALEKGWITSASVLVPCPWFPDVARWAKAHPEADLGIHLALNSEWTGYRGPARGAASLSTDGYALWSGGGGPARPEEVEAELRTQITRRALRVAFPPRLHMPRFPHPELFAVYAARRRLRTAGLIERLGSAGRGAAFSVGPQADALVHLCSHQTRGDAAGAGRVREMLAPLPRRLSDILHLATTTRRCGRHAVIPTGARLAGARTRPVKSAKFRAFLKARGSCSDWAIRARPSKELGGFERASAAQRGGTRLSGSFCRPSQATRRHREGAQRFAGSCPNSSAPSSPAIRFRDLGCGGSWSGRLARVRTPSDPARGRRSMWA